MCDQIIENMYSNKGVYTVLITLLFYKYLNPDQDIRLHQNTLRNGNKKGFSGRSFDTNYITPVLKQLDLASMAESGWLTRSLEQHFNYKYETSGAAKLPMIAFHSIYQILIKEVSKFSLCHIPDIGSYTASDRTSKTTGDLEVFKSDGLLNCYDKNNVFIEKRTPMTPQQMQMYQAQQQANMQQINQIYQQSQMNRPVFCNKIGTMTMCQ